MKTEVTITVLNYEKDINKFIFATVYFILSCVLVLYCFTVNAINYSIPSCIKLGIRSGLWRRKTHHNGYARNFDQSP